MTLRTERTDNSEREGWERVWYQCKCSAYRTYLFSIQTNLSDLHTQEDLPSICEQLIQINLVSLIQEHSALVKYVGLQREHISIFHIAGTMDFQNLLSWCSEKFDHITMNNLGFWRLTFANHGVSTAETPFPSTLSPSQLLCSNITPWPTELTPGNICRECTICLHGKELQLKTFSTTYLAYPKTSPMIRIARCVLSLQYGYGWKAGTNSIKGIWQEECQWQWHVLLTKNWMNVLLSNNPLPLLSIECTTCWRSMI